LREARRFEKASDALTEVKEGYDRWTGGLGSRAVEASFGVLAANWIVFGSARALLENGFAKWSVGVIVVFLGANLLLTALMAKLYGDRCDYADADKERWQSEFAIAARKGNSWPYTPTMDRLGDFLRYMRTWAPVIGGALFLLGLSTG
jgi:hypothetical protein